jgi:hypothetical protein
MAVRGRGRAPHSFLGLSLPVPSPSALAHPDASARALSTPGHDTTSFTLTAMIFFLATHPEVEAAVIGEVDRWGRNKDFDMADQAAFPYINVRGREGRAYVSVWLLVAGDAARRACCWLQGPKGRWEQTARSSSSHQTLWYGQRAKIMGLPPAGPPTLCAPHASPPVGGAV